MKPPHLLGVLAYLFGYPLFRLLIRGSHRTYLLLIVGDTALVTKNWLGFQRKWRLPGGGVKPGEDDTTAVLREVAEEIGVQLASNQLTLLGSGSFASRFGYTYSLYACVLASEPTIKPDEREILNAIFMPKTRLRAAYISEELSQALRLRGWL